MADGSGAPYTEEQETGLRFFELSHPWGHHTPTHPGFRDTIIYRGVTIAEHGVMSQRIKMVMHNTTHVNAPLHLIPGGLSIGEIGVDRFFGPGAVIALSKKRWELVGVDDLERAGADIRAGDIVILNLGWHAKYSDSQEYFGEAPGLSKEAAEWLVDRRVKMVGVDTPNIDHPLATLLGPHRKGPLMRRLPAHYERETGRNSKDDFPEFAPAHKTLLAAGVPTIENIGGDLDAVTGARSTFHAMPWKWTEGDACVVRLVAIQDPTQDFRLGGSS